MSAPTADTPPTPEPAIPESVDRLLRVQLDRAGPVPRDASPEARSACEAGVQAMFDNFEQPGLLKALMAARMVVMHNAGMECFHRASLPGSEPPDMLAAVNTGARLFAISGHHSDRIAGQKAPRPKAASAGHVAPPPEPAGPFFVRWLDGPAPGRSWDNPNPDFKPDPA